MPRNKTHRQSCLSRSRDEKVRNAEKAWELRTTECLTQRQIAVRMGVTQQSVQRWLKATSIRHEKELMRDVGKVKTEQLGQLEVVVEEGMKAWINGRDKGWKPDDRYLLLVCRALDDMRKIMCIDVPKQKIELTGKDGRAIEHRQLTPEQRASKIAALLNKGGARRTGHSDRSE